MITRRTILGAIPLAGLAAAAPLQALAAPTAQERFDIAVKALTAAMDELAEGNDGWQVILNRSALSGALSGYRRAICLDHVPISAGRTMPIELNREEVWFGIVEQERMPTNPAKASA